MKTVKGGLIISLALILMALTVSVQAIQRLVLCEMFTNTSSPGCYNADLILDRWTHDYPNVFVAIRYHVEWPSTNDPYYLYNTSENQARKDYYSIPVVPYAQVDGLIDGGDFYYIWWNLIEGHSSEEAPLEITLGGFYDEDTRNGTIDITVVVTDFIEWTNLKIRIALTESNIYWEAPNGSVWHNQTMRDMIPATDGIPIEISQGDTVELSQDFSCPSPLVAINCQLVVFVQSDNDREVLQTARVWVDNLDDPVSIDDVRAEVPSRFELAQNYPNPFNACTTIDYIIESEGHVELVVYDLNGREVATLVNGVRNPGHYQVIWDGTDSDGNEVSSGIYFYRLVAGCKNIGRRMVLLK